MLKINKTHQGEARGLTLIELLVTIAVLAIVAAIAVPVVTNVVSSTNDRAVAQTESDIANFTEKYNKSGAYTYDPATGTFSGYVDLNGDGSATEDEKIEELVVDLETFEIGSLGEAAPSTVGEIDYDNPTATTFSIIDYEITASPASVTINGWANNAITPTSVSLENAVGDVTWTVSEGSLPVGLSINPSTGIVTGTPENEGSTVVTIQGTDEQGATITQSHSYSISPEPILSPSDVNTEGLAGEEVEISNATLAGFTGPYTWAVTSGSLPAGLSLDSGTGSIAGTPEDASTGSFVLTLTDANGLTASQTHTYEFAISGFESASFSYTGGVQSFTAPYSGDYKLEAWGAQGGNDPANSSYIGGRGGYSVGTVSLNAGDELYIYVGGQGTGCTTSGWQSTGGGGATDFRLIGGAWNNSSGLFSRILVAGGGGGRHGETYEGQAILGNDGGGYTASTFTSNGITVYGPNDRSPGTSSRSSGWESGAFGYAIPTDEGNTCSTGGFNGGARGSDNWANGGGGGGWYGGTTSWPTGGGGSGYTVTSGSYKPNGYNVDSRFYMSDTDLISGNASMPNPSGGFMTGNRGNGFAKISVD